ncbi:MAG: TOBE domain-containing protein [Coriobacteriales bacterium]|nr:TOBE domain-containing protein [Coriobacteriales bacterium]
MNISARNQFHGVITDVKEGAVNGVVSVKLDGGATIKANITNEAIEELGLAQSIEAIAVFKANNVMFASGNTKLAISARNQFPGKIALVQEGAVNGRVVLETAEGMHISGSVTSEAIEELGLAEGVEAIAFVKSTDVMIGLIE